ncbi:hypothetical protein [Roseateles sp.]|uniref:hypothetical protein n=1 Tax=Roseateles sp. TaxID=1971397 RepID=UPI003D12F302
MNEFGPENKQLVELLTKVLKDHTNDQLSRLEERLEVFSVGVNQRLDQQAEQTQQLAKSIADLTQRVLELESAAESRDEDMSSRMRFLMNRMSDLDGAQRTSARAASVGFAPAYSSNEARLDGRNFHTRERDVRARSPMEQ